MLGMFSLRRRRLKGDMIKVFKIIRGIDKVNLGKLFCIDDDEGTRNHSLLYLTDLLFSWKSSSIFKIKLNEFITD